MIRFIFLDTATRVEQQALEGTTVHVFGPYLIIYLPRSKTPFNLTLFSIFLIREWDSGAWSWRLSAQNSLVFTLASRVSLDAELFRVHPTHHVKERSLAKKRIESTIAYRRPGDVATGEQNSLVVEGHEVSDEDVFEAHRPEIMFLDGKIEAHRLLDQFNLTFEDYFEGCLE